MTVAWPLKGEGGSGSTEICVFQSRLVWGGGCYFLTVLEVELRACDCEVGALPLEALALFALIIFGIGSSAFALTSLGPQSSNLWLPVKLRWQVHHCTQLLVEMGVSITFLPGMASNFDPTDLCRHNR
jgi:hypothetical protein